VIRAVCESEMTLRRFVFLIKSVRNFASDATKSSNFRPIPGPKYYPFLGPFNDMLTMGKPEK
jgi:hypothetical protein